MYSNWLRFIRNITEVRDRWRSEIKRGWHAGVEGFKPVFGSFSGRILVTAAKIKVSPLKTERFYLIHRYKIFSAFQRFLLHFFPNKNSTWAPNFPSMLGNQAFRVFMSRNLLRWWPDSSLISVWKTYFFKNSL